MTTPYVPVDNPTGNAALTLVASVDDDDPSVPMDVYTKLKPRRDKCRTVLNGVEAVRDAGETINPKLEGESQVRYDVRKKLGALHPAFTETVHAAAGLITQTEPTFERMPQEIIDLHENWDGNGTHATVMGQRLIAARMVDGYAGEFTDYTRVDSPSVDRSRASAALELEQPLDAGDEAALGLRPYVINVFADDVLKTGYRNIGGVRVLTLMVRREVVTKEVGLFGQRKITQWRVYRRDRNNVVTAMLYRRKSEGARPEVAEGPFVMTNADQIPWSPMGEEDSAPLAELLADLVIQYHQIKNGMLSLQSLGFVPTTVRIGAPTSYVNEAGETVQGYPPMILGIDRVIEVPSASDGGATSNPVYYHQPKPDVLTPAALMLERTDKEIGAINGAFFGRDVQVEQSGVALKQKSRGGNANIAALAREFKDCRERTCQHIGMFLRKTAGSVKVKLTFEDVKLSAQEVSAINALVNTGFPVLTAVIMLIDGDVLPKGSDAQAIADLWEDNRAVTQAIEADAVEQDKNVKDAA